MNEIKMGDLKPGRSYRWLDGQLDCLDHSPLVNQLNRGLNTAQIRYPEQGVRYERMWIEVDGRPQKIDRVVMVKAAKSSTEPDVVVKLRGTKEAFTRGLRTGQEWRHDYS